MTVKELREWAERKSWRLETQYKLVPYTAAAWIDLALDGSQQLCVVGQKDINSALRALARAVTKVREAE